MKPFKKIAISILAALPIPSISFAAQQWDLVENIDTDVAKKSFIEAINTESLPDNYYKVMEDEGLNGVDEIFYIQNTDLLNGLVDKWKTDLDGEIFMAQSTTSELPTEGIQEK